MSLEDKIECYSYYVDRFNSWKAKEVNLGNNRFYYEIRKPKSECQKVCMYVDGHTMLIYGDYGELVFDKMTWIGSPYNLYYDDDSYQMEKLSRYSRESINVFDDCECCKDIIKWVKDRVSDEGYDDKTLEKIFEFIGTDGFKDFDDATDFCEENGLDEIENLFIFAVDALDNTDEYEWISWLRRSNLDDFDEVCSSELWDAGKRINQRYYINLLAMKICGEKLKKMKDSNIEGQMSIDDFI